jgi:hypothetical protein
LVLPVNTCAQNTLAETPQLPERISMIAPNLGARVISWLVPVAVKEYHTSLAVSTLKPQPVVGGSDWVALSTVPLSGVEQLVATDALMAWAQSSLGA